MCHACPVSLGQTLKKADGNLLFLDFSDDIQHRKAMRLELLETVRFLKTRV